MSLRVDLQITQEYLERLRDAGGSLTVYKLLRLSTDREDLASPHVTHHLWERGWNQAEGELPSPLTDGTIVNGGGFHVFIDEPEPDTLMANGEEVCVAFLASEQDFVCAGRHELADETHAIFRRLYLAVGDHELARKDLLERPPSTEDELLATGFANSSQLILAPYQQRARDQHTTVQFSCRKADRDVYHRWLSENTDSGWLRRALVEVEPRDSTKPSRVWLQHRERSRPVRVVSVASIVRAARAPSPPEAA